MLAASPPGAETKTARRSDVGGLDGLRSIEIDTAGQRCERNHAKPKNQNEIEAPKMSVHSIEHRNATFWSLENLSVAKRRIVDYLTSRPAGATRHEIAAALGMPLSSVAGRVCELEAEGFVRSTEETRPTPYGKTATVVQVTHREKPIQLELFS